MRTFRRVRSASVGFSYGPYGPPKAEPPDQAARVAAHEARVALESPEPVKRQARPERGVTLLVARYLAVHGPASVEELRQALAEALASRTRCALTSALCSGLGPWFDRPRKGVYRLSRAGRARLEALGG